MSEMSKNKNDATSLFKNYSNSHSVGGIHKSCEPKSGSRSFFSKKPTNAGGGGGGMGTLVGVKILCEP